MPRRLGGGKGDTRRDREIEKILKEIKEENPHLKDVERPKEVTANLLKVRKRVRRKKGIREADRIRRRSLTKTRRIRKTSAGDIRVKEVAKVRRYLLLLLMKLLSQQQKKCAKVVAVQKKTVRFAKKVRSD